MARLAGPTNANAVPSSSESPSKRLGVIKAVAVISESVPTTIVTAP